MKFTAKAPSNIAFIKYWGKKDEVLRLPENGSLSMNLSNLTTTTTVEFVPQYTKDEVTNNDQRIISHLDRIRKLAGITLRAKVVTANNFPSGTGLSSSASGFAALSVAGAAAAGLSLSKKELSILARQGSGSACRSIPDGFVEWIDGDISETSYAVSLYPPEYWNLVDIVAIVTTEKKTVATSEGQKLHKTSPFFPIRLQGISAKIVRCKKSLAEKNFQALGELIEAEALEMHAIMLTSSPALLYFLPETLAIMKEVLLWRNQGVPVYFTINTGQNIHLLCEEQTVPQVREKLGNIAGIQSVIVNTPSVGARMVNSHLF